MGERGDWFEKLKFSRIVSLEISAALPRETIASTRGWILSGEKFSKFCFSIEVIVFASHGNRIRTVVRTGGGKEKEKNR